MRAKSSERDSGESGKNLLDGTRSNPKYFSNRKSAGNRRIVLPSTTRTREVRRYKRTEMFSPKP